MAFKILIVDDDQSIRRYLVDVLTDSNYETVTAADIPSAMHVLTQGAIDLLVTDVRLDGYNGLYLIAMTPEPIPAVVITGYNDVAIEAEARKLGADYLVKPICSEQLREAVKRRLANIPRKLA